MESTIKAQRIAISILSIILIVLLVIIITEHNINYELEKTNNDYKEYSISLERQLDKSDSITSSYKDRAYNDSIYKNTIDSIMIKYKFKKTKDENFFDSIHCLPDSNRIQLLQSWYGKR